MAKAEIKDRRFRDRTYSTYRDHQKRSGGRLDFSLDELREHLTKALERPLCRYCNKGLTIETVSLDHIVPVSRGGSYALSNSQWICKPCNVAKGDLKHVEYAALLIKLEELEREFRNPNIRSRVVMALKVSASFRFGAARRAKSGKQ